jgi:hypothetical protein
MKRLESEVLMLFQATPNEIIAFNAAIRHFQQYGHFIYPDVYQDVSRLLAQFQQRLNERLPAQGGSHERF